MYGIAIASVALLHAGYLVFQTWGALLALRSRYWLVPHLAAVTWGITIVAVQGSCPLTRLEKHLIAQSGGTPYSESYLDYYLFGTLLPDGTQTLVYALHLLVIAATYGFVLPRLGRRPQEPSVPEVTIGAKRT
jgi:hypothetical protein